MGRGESPAVIKGFGKVRVCFGDGNEECLVVSRTLRKFAAMKACLNCEKEYQHKRESSKFCSDKCRVMYNRKNKVDREKQLEKGIMEILNETKAAVKQMSSDLFMFGQARMDGQPLIAGITPETPFKVVASDEPLSFDKMKQEITSKPTYLQLLNGMANIHFSDEKEDYAKKIYAADHLSQRQIDALINALRQKQ